MNVSAVANHFLTTACFTEGNGCLILQIWPKTHARELISHRKGPLLRLFRQMDIISSYLLNLYLSTHTLVSFSVLSREVTLCRLFRDSRLAMVQRVSVCVVFSHKWNTRVTLPSIRSWGTLRRKGQKDCERQIREK